MHTYYAYILHIGKLDGNQPKNNLRTFGFPKYTDRIGRLVLSQFEASTIHFPQELSNTTLPKGRFVGH